MWYVCGRVPECHDVGGPCKQKYGVPGLYALFACAVGEPPHCRNRNRAHSTCTRLSLETCSGFPRDKVSPNRVAIAIYFIYSRVFIINISKQT